MSNNRISQEDMDATFPEPPVFETYEEMVAADIKAAAEAGTVPLTITVEREGDETFTTTTGHCFIALPDQPEGPTMRVIGDISDLGVSASMLIYVVATEFGPGAVDEFLERAKHLAAKMYLDSVMDGE